MFMLIRRPFWFFTGIVLIILAACFSLSNSAVALAAGPTNSSSDKMMLGILPGPLTVTMNSISFAGEITNGTSTTATYQLHISIIDATGSGSGWNLALANTLPSSTTAMLTHVNVACASNSTCNLPQNSVSYPVMIQSNDGTPTSILNARANTGMGAFDITATLSVTNPTSANANSFTEVLTLLISSRTM